VRIVFPSIMADPFAVGVDVRGVGVAGFVDVVSIFDWMSVSLGRCGTVGRRVRRRSFVSFLRECRSRTDERECKYA
jgi:hypothetical protein